MKRLYFSALVAAQLIPLALCQKIFPADLALPEAKPPVIQPVQIIGNQRVEGRIGRHTFFCAPVVREPLQEILGAIKWVLGRVPPELCSDILQNGIYLTGGSAALPNLDTMIATEFGVPVSVARDAGECTTLGAGYMADHFDMLGGVSGKKYKLAAGKTAKSILISCGARLAPFDIKEVREITMYDELELDLVGDRKTALFFIISDTDATFNFLVSMAYTQLFNLLCERADDKYGGRLPVHVRCLIDEAANIGQIPNLEKLMATIRSREISACLVLQAQSQLKALYKDNMDTIIGNCDASLFLGGKEETTLKSWNSLLGKETIDMYNTSVTKGTQESHGQNFQKLGKDLMSVDELAVMDGGKCLLQIRGVRPFLSRKYDITRHPNYRLLSDFNEKNAFDIEKFLSTKMPMRPGELYRNYEVTAEDLEAPAI